MTQFDLDNICRGRSASEMASITNYEVIVLGGGLHNFGGRLVADWGLKPFRRRPELGGQLPRISRQQLSGPFERKRDRNARPFRRILAIRELHNSDKH
jgi:hypothetical protein